MKVQDEAAWQGLLADFAIDSNPNAPILREFTIAWADKAERWLEVTYELDDIRHRMAMKALRETLPAVEDELQRYSVGVLGAALALLVMHWAYGENLFEDMTIIEQHLVEDTAIIKLAQLAAAAQQAGNEEEK